MANASDETLGRELMAHGRAAWRVALAILGEPATAEDAVQEAYARVWSARASVRREVSVRAYLLRAVANTAQEIARAEHSRRRREERAGEAGSGRGGRLDAELAARLERALSSLDEGTRLAVELHHGEGLSHAEVAGVLAIDPAAARKRASRGLARLRDSLAGAGLALAPAALTGALGTASPAVPAALGARLGRIVSGRACAAAGGAAAAKGGFVMKLVTGIILAGAAAGVAVMSLPDRGGAFPAGAAPGGALQEHAHEAKFKLVPVMGVRGRGSKGTFCHARMSGGGILDGPGMEADFCDVDEIDVDSACNAYWTEAGQFNILRRWDRETGLVTTLAGSACGDLDGPLGRARFGGWGGGGYGASSIAVSGDGKHVFIRDSGNGGKLRHVDLEAGTVRTMGDFFPARDPAGEIHILDPKGGAVPPGKGYKPLKTAALEWQRGSIGWGTWWVLDAAHEKLYTHARGPVAWFDLKTGKLGGWVTWNRGSKAAARQTDTTGPAATSNFQCPIGLSISPGGRYLYMGGGDSYSFWRLDLEKEYVHIFGLLPDGSYGFRDGPHEKSPGCMHAMWPSHPRFAADGSACWSGPSGIFRLVPVK